MDGRAQSLYCAAAIENGAMRFAYCALRHSPSPLPVIARLDGAIQ
jgi:hypothetical protein